ncbi:MAG: hypothetical protein JXB14_05540 [Candidatus Altiarchaeota archaeon]|nr:hypothetical protein [Candidatus Altiarchaeota archaeon]
MNTVLVLLLLILVIFALKEGMIWVALGIGLLMVLLSVGEDETREKKKFLYQSPDVGGISPSKEQMLRVKYQPTWDGNSWWEEMPEHWGMGLGRMFGLLR